MAITLRVEEDQTRAGHALVIITGLAAAPARPKFRISREGYDRAQMGPNGWQVAEALLDPVDARSEMDRLVLVVGPQVTQYTEAGPVIFALPSAEIEAAVMWPDIDVVTPPPVPAPAPPPPPPRSEAEPPIQPLPLPTRPPPPVPAPVTDRRLPRWLVLLGIALVLAGVGIWIFREPLGLVERTSSATASTPRSASAPPTQSAPEQRSPPPPTQVPTWLELSDAMSLEDLVRGAQDPTAIHAAALRRQAAGKYDDALSLFEEAADRGYAPSSTALAHMYDPNGFVPGRPFRTADPRVAAKYYRAGANGGDVGAEAPRAALKQYLEGQRTTNPTAAAALQESWP